jgi:hypothetical protein
LCAATISAPIKAFGTETSKTATAKLAASEKYLYFS